MRKNLNVKYRVHVYLDGILFGYKLSTRGLEEMSYQTAIKVANKCVPGMTQNGYFSYAVRPV